ncbi:hypothetical protein [Pseudomonas sp. LB3P38]|uniref:hypothetical protein n=1 Tax=Pseudomonas lyxosi TaxID=3398358 RepID=UPI0039F0F789
MKTMKIQRVRRRCAWVMVLFGWGIEPALGASMDITAVFRPDPSKPMDNKFINQTPVTGHCQFQPQFCKEFGLFSLLTPIWFDSVAPIEARHTDARRGAMFRVPGDWRRLSVRHNATNEEAEVEVRIVSIGGRYYLNDTAENLVGEGEPTDNQSEWHRRLWGGTDWTWGPPAPCVGSGGGMYVTPAWRSFFWLTSSTNVCAATAHYRIGTLRYDQVQIGYELRTPNPLKMSSGQYTGRLDYSVGPGMDFDMGDIMQSDDSTLTLSFNLDVEHTLKVDVPPGGNRIELVPQGGWQSWLQNGRKPTRLFRDQTFTISASSRFKMNLECQYSQDGQTCSVLDPVSGHTVPLNVSVSLPHGLTDAAGQPVNRRQLLRDGSGTQLFQPGIYVDSKPGTLHFEIPASEVGEMIQPGQQRQYSGDVTVIWDSEVG